MNTRLNTWSRRDWLLQAAAAGVSASVCWHTGARAQAVVSARGPRVLVLVELKGGNDGLNTVVPYADPRYAALRPTLALPRDQVLALDERTGLHPELKALLPLWERQELAIVQGVGYPQPNLSHFRSIEIWETASRSNEYLEQGWVARAMRAGLGTRQPYTAEGVVIGSGDLGALAGARAVALTDPAAFVAQARLARPTSVAGNAALQHLLQVEAGVSTAAEGLKAERYPFTTEFPQGAFGNAVRAAAQVLASQRGRAGIPVITLTLGSFDTHQNQLAQHAGLLRQLGEGMAAFRGALGELGLWEQSLVMTFSEFGRRARQNQSGGTDHGTSSAHLVAGGAVRGGFFGRAPDLDRLDETQNLVYSTDFRQLYATVAQQWWGVDARTVLGGVFEPIPFLRT